MNVSSTAKSNRRTAAIVPMRLCIPFSGTTAKHPFRYALPSLEKIFVRVFDRSSFVVQLMLISQVYISAKSFLTAIVYGLMIWRPENPTNSTLNSLRDRQITGLGVHLALGSIAGFCAILTCDRKRSAKLLVECSVVSMAAFFCLSIFVIGRQVLSNPIDFLLILMCSCWTLHTKQWILSFWLKLLVAWSLVVAFVFLVDPSERASTALVLVATIGLTIVYHLSIQWNIRNAFYRIGYAHYDAERVRNEGFLIKCLIDSIMPRKISEQVMCDLDRFRANLGGGFKTETNKSDSYLKEDETTHEAEVIKSQHPSIGDPTQQQQQPIEVERPYVVRRMHNVSILFADIVGFTRMSSNKSAHELVGLLVDLYGRFDSLCTQLGCEKIATLGDCYYCVSGCPDERADHANCCINMGLAMIDAIRVFDVERGEQVQMRVGVHTGSVNCGVLGVHKFKFDIFSHDVTLANHLESTGKPGYVHITECTFNSLVDSNEMETTSNRYAYNIQQADSVNFQGKSYQTFLISSASSDSAPLPTSTIETTEPSEIVSFRTFCGFPSLLEKLHHPERGLLHGELLYHKCFPVHELFDACYHPNSIVPPLSQNPQAQMAANLQGNGAGSSLLVQEVADDETAISLLEVIKPTPADLAKASENGDDELEDILIDESDVTGKDVLQLDIDSKVQECLERSYHQILEESTMPFSTGNNRKCYYVEDIRACQQHLSKLTLRFKSDSAYEAVDYEAEFDHARFWRSGLSHVDRSYINLSQSSLGTSMIHALILCLHLTSLIGAVIIQLPTKDKPLITAFAAILGILYTLLLALSVPTILHSRTNQIPCQYSMRRFVQPAISLIFTSCPLIVTIIICSRGFNFSPFFIVLTTTALVLQILSVPSGPSVIYFRWIMRSLFIIGIFVVVAITLIVLAKQKPSLAQFFELIGTMSLLVVYMIAISIRFEIAQRNYIFVRAQQTSERQANASEKARADWLLKNVIPAFVIGPLMTHKHYAQDYETVGVAFITLTNYLSELYEEQFEGGQFYGRVLNELFADVDACLTDSESLFSKHLEKIKTIGATYMVASGLSPHSMEPSNDGTVVPEHLIVLLDFVFAFKRIADRFSEDLFNFNFVVRAGFNFGPLTAGVLGTHRLSYDIWGDTVNVASRMDSKGVENRVQVAAHVAEALQYPASKYNFTKRGMVFIKGKDMMDVYLVDEADC